MYRILKIDDFVEWMDILGSFKETDIYYHPGYLKPFSGNGDGEPVLFYFENEYGRVANVFLTRDLYTHKGLSPYLNPNQYFDISTVYGYGGPIFEAVDPRKLGECYVNEFEKYCTDMNVITEFIRFHPILKNHTFLENLYEVHNIRSTVHMDLSQGESYLWECLASNCKRNIKKAQGEGMNVIFGNDKFLVDEFINLYLKTMYKDNASSYYFFNNKFFYTTMDELRNNSFIFAAVFRQKIIAACIVLFSDQLVHYHLAGSDIEYQSLRPNNVLIYEVAKWGSREGKKALHLGGGVSGDEDNLFRFKKSFSKAAPLSFYIGKKIYNQTVYNELIHLRALNEGDFDRNTNYFPKYRG